MALFFFNQVLTLSEKLAAKEITKSGTRAVASHDWTDLKGQVLGLWETESVPVSTARVALLFSGKEEEQKFKWQTTTLWKLYRKKKKKGGKGKRGLGGGVGGGRRKTSGKKKKKKPLSRQLD